MPMVRRYLPPSSAAPSGLTQRIFSTLNFISDSRCSLESGIVVRTDRFAAGEIAGHTFISDTFTGSQVLRQWQNDIVSAAENQRLFQADGAARGELAGGVGSDFFAAGENAALTLIDRFSAVENQRALGTDAIARAELATTVSYDRLGLAEALSGIATDAFALSEDIRTGFSTDGFGTVESRAALSSDTVGRAENQAMFTADGVPRLEAAISFAKDQIAAAEYLGRVTRDALPALEMIGRAMADVAGLLEAGGSVEMVADTRQAYIESRAGVVSDGRGQAENLITIAAMALTADAAGLIELLSVRLSDGVARGEFLSSIVSDRLARVENATGLRSDGIARGENQVILRTEGFAAGEERGAGFVGDIAALLEYRLTVAADAAVINEAQRTVTADFITGAAENRTQQFDDLTIPLETVAGRAGDGRGTEENQATLLAVLRAALETQGLSFVRVEGAAVVEIAGISFLPLADLRGLLEAGQAGGDDAIVPIENRALFGFPFDPDAPILIDGPYLVLDKTHTAVSSSRVRVVTVPYASLGLSAQPFDPLATNTFDIFAFDFTLDAVGATIERTSWTATFDPGSSGAEDDTPEARVVTAWPTPVLYTVNPFDNSIQTWNGAFTAAMIGACPASAAGGTYTLAATVWLSDTRILEISTTVLCVALQA